MVRGGVGAKAKKTWASTNIFSLWDALMHPPRNDLRFTVGVYAQIDSLFVLVNRPASRQALIRTEH
jgi:hypothetical protein